MSEAGRAGALERLYEAALKYRKMAFENKPLDVVLAARAEMEVATYAVEVLPAVEQGAPEGYRCPGCIAWGEKHTVLLFKLAAARAAIREAAEIMTEKRGAPLSRFVVADWLARLAVRQAREET